MQRKSDKKSKKKDTRIYKGLLEKDEKSAKFEEQSSTKIESASEQKDATSRGPFSGRHSLIQSTYGNKGNFELIVPLATGGMAHYTRHNDIEELP
jgi:hypothetical protein